MIHGIIRFASIDQLADIERLAEQLNLGERALLELAHRQSLVRKHATYKSLTYAEALRVLAWMRRELMNNSDVLRRAQAASGGAA